MLTLKSTSYRWSITHLLAESDTDLFSAPFELDAIACYPYVGICRCLAACRVGFSVGD